MSHLEKNLTVKELEDLLRKKELDNCMNYLKVQFYDFNAYTKELEIKIENTAKYATFKKYQIQVTTILENNGTPENHVEIYSIEEPVPPNDYIYKTITVYYPENANGKPLVKLVSCGEKESY